MQPGDRQSWDQGLIDQAWAAYQRDADRLVEDHAGQWVAYHGERIVGFADTREAAWQLCLDQGLSEGTFWAFDLRPIGLEEYLGGSA